MLYSSDDEIVRNIIRTVKGNFRTYSTLSPEQAERIKNIMQDERYGIPEKLRENILFSMKYSIK